MRVLKFTTSLGLNDYDDLESFLIYFILCVLILLLLMDFNVVDHHLSVCMFENSSHIVMCCDTLSGKIIENELLHFYLIALSI